MQAPVLSRRLHSRGTELTVSEWVDAALNDREYASAICALLVEHLELEDCFELCETLGNRLLDQMVDAKPQQTRRLLDIRAASLLEQQAIPADHTLLLYALFEARKTASRFSAHIDDVLSRCLSELPERSRRWGWFDVFAEWAVPFRRGPHRPRPLHSRREILQRLELSRRPYFEQRPVTFDAVVEWQGQAHTVEVWWWLALRGHVQTTALDALFAAWLEALGAEACFELTQVRSGEACPPWVTDEPPLNPGHGFSLDQRIFHSMLRRDPAAARALLDRRVEDWPEGEAGWVPASERLLGLGQVDALHHGGSYRPSITGLIEEVRVSSERRRAFLWDPAAHDPVSTIVERVTPPLPPLPADASYDQRLTRALTLGELGETDASQSMLTALADQLAPSPRLATFVEAARAGGEGAASLAHLREAVALLPCSAAASNALLRARVVLGDPEGAWAEKERLREARLASPDTAFV